jgi:hyperosmotically inducible periplasmic protein
MLKVLILTISLLFAPLASGQTANKSDDRIEDLVRVRLAGNRDTGGAGRIKVTVKDAVVTLTGDVESDRQKGAAEKQAKKVKGVKSVVNQLTVVNK